MIRRNVKRFIVFMVLFMPSIVFADEYLVCGYNGDRVYPLIFGTIFSTLYNLIRILVPVIFVITGIVSFLKVTVSSKADEGLGKAKEKLIRNIIAAIIIFFLMSIINFVISLVAGVNNSFTGCLDCLLHPNSCQKIEVSNKLCSGLLSDQDKYDENCKLKPGVTLGDGNYGSGDTGISDPVTGGSYGGSIGEWSTWKQCDSRWGGMRIASSGSTICQVGCLITSVSIQIARSGTTLTVSDFNPGVFMQHAGFSGAGLNWNSWFSVAPNFKLINDYKDYGSKAEKANKIKSYIDQGYYVIAAVKNEGHWVAVDRVEGEKIYIFDPGWNYEEIFSSYAPQSVYRFLVFENEG